MAARKTDDRFLPVLTGEEQEDSHPLSVNLMMLGYTGVGKTFFLGSLAKLSRIMGEGGITLKTQAYVDRGPLDVLYGSMGITEGSIDKTAATIGIKKAEMKLKRGMNVICPVNFYDVEGEAVEPGRNVEIGEHIRKAVQKQHGLFLAIKCPTKDEGSAKATAELAQMLEFASESLCGDHNKPVALLLTQMDRCEELASIEEDVLNMNSLKESAQIVNAAIETALSQRHVAEIIEQFRRNICLSGQNIPNRVVPCASLGIGNVMKSEVGGENYLSKLDFFIPYGTIAAFLWAVYVKFSLDKDFQSKSFMELHGSGQEILKGVLDDLTELHKNGEAFHGSSELWKMNAISELYMFKRIGRG